MDSIYAQMMTPLACSLRHLDLIDTYIKFLFRYILLYQGDLAGETPGSY